MISISMFTSYKLRVIYARECEVGHIGEEFFDVFVGEG
jgi:hypothetical protein